MITGDKATGKVDIIHKINEMVTGEDDDFSGEFLFGDDEEVKIGRKIMTGKQIKDKVNNNFVERVIGEEESWIDWDFYWDAMEDTIAYFLYKEE